ncbi:hypothetical protein TNCT_241941 [Trichonephila clavata]|uniref:Uncharacterized protein n=1 Tax=Trichonephila clavata TaxID=2740835 RepID=A0A8X6J428_TRICU|nr:hypothetical protein TNCT_241941 [Trichonephila clavata]
MTEVELFSPQRQGAKQKKQQHSENKGQKTPTNVLEQRNGIESGFEECIIQMDCIGKKSSRKRGFRLES